MTQIDPLPTDEADVLAAELALGLLEGPELAAALERQIGDPAFARAVLRWRDHFALLAHDVPEVAPPPGAAQRVIAAVRGTASPARAVPLRPVSRAVRWWQAAALAGGALAAGLAGVLVMRPATPPPVATAPAAPQLVAALKGKDDAQTLLVSVDATQRVRIAGRLAVPAGRVAQLWLIAGEAPPRSLGLLRAEADAHLRLQAALPAGLAQGAVLAISIEPEGGSPTGLPTGPVVASGPVQTI